MLTQGTGTTATYQGSYCSELNTVDLFLAPMGLGSHPFHQFKEIPRLTSPPIFLF